MPYHAYVDESGTMDHQGVISVAMIVLEGAHSAQRLHNHVMSALNRRHIQLIKRLKKERKPLPQLHFTDMTIEQRQIVAECLAKAKVTVFTAHHHHKTDKTHPERFAIYTELVKICLNSAFTEHKELVVGIGKQGGWQKYEPEFIAKLRKVPENYGEFREASFDLLSAARPGIQLADFYVGTVRASVMDERSFIYDFVQEQVICREIYTLEPAKIER